jgi:xylulose-5-phosphate/fructose-6-phosphate phosphoketolase
MHDDSLLEQPLALDHAKPRLLGYWGTPAGPNMFYVHLNRLIKDNDLDRSDSASICTDQTRS